MTEAEKKQALEKLDVLAKCTPPGAWQIRDIGAILRILVTDAKPADVGRVVDKPEPYDADLGNRPSARTLRGRR